MCFQHLDVQFNAVFTAICLKRAVRAAPSTLDGGRNQATQKFKLVLVCPREEALSERLLPVGPVLGQLHLAVWSERKANP